MKTLRMLPMTALSLVGALTMQTRSLRRIRQVNLWDWGSGASRQRVLGKYRAPLLVIPVIVMVWPIRFSVGHRDDHHDHRCWLFQKLECGVRGYGIDPMTGEEDTGPGYCQRDCCEGLSRQTSP